jgi:SAM-dependent methyltransferase
VYDRVLGLVHGSSLVERYKKIAGEIGKGKRVFDLACGTGMLHNFLDKSCSYVGWDCNKKFVEYCRKKGLNVYKRDMFDYAGYPKSDVIVLCDILHHICPRDKEVVEHALRNTGKLIVVEPLKPYRLKLPKKLLKIYDRFFGDSDGVNRFEDRIKWNFSEEGLVNYFNSFRECKTQKMNLDVIAVYERH